MKTPVFSLSADCRSMDVPLVVIAIPRAGKADAVGAREVAMARLAGITARNATPFIDLIGVFDKFDASTVEVAAWDDHPNAFGHRRIFLGLARGLTDNPSLYHAIFGTESHGPIALP